MDQDTIVLIIVALCAVLVARGIVRRIRGKKGGCGCSDGSGCPSGGCGGCPVSAECKDRKKLRGRVE